MTPSEEPQTEFNENASQTALQPPRRPMRWLWSLLGLLTLGGAGFAAWRFLTPTTPTPKPIISQPQTPGAPVKLVTIQSGTIQETSDFVASLEARRSVTLQSNIQGQITQVLARSGETVKKGAPLLQIEPRLPQAAVSSVNTSVLAAQTLQSQLENARATLKSLENQRATIQADVKLNEQEYQRYETLASQGAVSRQIKDQYSNRLAASKTNLAAVESKIKAEQTTIAQAEKAVVQAQAQANVKQPSTPQSQNNRVIAPFAGVVGDVSVKIGDFVNTSTQLLTLTQNQPLEVHIFIPIERAPQLKNGMTVEIMDVQGQIIGSSNVFFIAPNAVNNTQSILIKALYNNPKNELRADQFVRARVIWKQRPGVSVPTSAISRIAGETFVYVAQPQTSGASKFIAQQKPVVLGNIKGSKYQILEGLQPGERVITSGLLNLRDGDPVLPES
jgi:RND family efflux transporter MFP subunit